jgi:hypothetical protein
MPRAILMPPLAPSLWVVALVLLGVVDRPDTIRIPVVLEAVLAVLAYGSFLVLNVLLAMPFALATLAVTRHPAAALLVAMAVGAAAAEVALRAGVVAGADTLFDAGLSLRVAGPMALLGLGSFHFLRLHWLDRRLTDDG